MKLVLFEKTWFNTTVFCGGGGVGIGDHLASVLVSRTGQQPDGELIDIAARKGPTTFRTQHVLLLWQAAR